MDGHTADSHGLTDELLSIELMLGIEAHLDMLRASEAELVTWYCKTYTLR